MSATAIVEFRGVSKRYRYRRKSLIRPPQSVLAVDGVSLSIHAGETFGLVGESGSGKSTLAKLLLKLETPGEGQVLVEGRDVFAQSKADEKRYRGTVQAVLQDPYGALSPRMRIERIIAEPAMAVGKNSGDARAIVREMLHLVGLQPEAAGRYPHEFSGGQRQRIAIARALSIHPRVLVLDEAVSALDVSIRAQILILLKELQARLGMAYFFIGHDLAVVRLMSTRVGVMYLGRLVETGPARRIFGRPFHPYTRELVSVAESVELRGSRMKGEIPSPMNMPGGCAFRMRCALATEICATQVPALRDAGDGQHVACHHAGAHSASAGACAQLQTH